MTIEGMDVDRVRNVARRLDRQAEALQSVVASIDGLVRQAIDVWMGNDARAFAGWWQSQWRPALIHAHDSLAGLSRSAGNNATEQEKTSSALGSGVVGAGIVGGAAVAGAAAVVPSTTASSIGRSSAVTAGYLVGPQNISNSAIAAAAEAELKNSPGRLPTGWDKPGECMVSAQRWVTEAGGKVNKNGEVAGSYSGVATPVAMAQVRRGDIIQYQDPAAPNTDWNHVHTLVVVGADSNGSLNIIERNYDLQGSIREVNGWTPAPHSGWVAQAYRYGDQP